MRKFCNTTIIVSSFSHLFSFFCTPLNRDVMQENADLQFYFVVCLTACVSVSDLICAFFFSLSSLPQAGTVGRKTLKGQNQGCDRIGKELTWKQYSRLSVPPTSKQPLRQLHLVLKISPCDQCLALILVSWETCCLPCASQKTYDDQWNLQNSKLKNMRHGRWRWLMMGVRWLSSGLPDIKQEEKVIWYFGFGVSTETLNLSHSYAGFNGKKLFYHKYKQ